MSAATIQQQFANRSVNAATVKAFTMPPRLVRLAKTIDLPRPTSGAG